MSVKNSDYEYFSCLLVKDVVDKLLGCHENFKRFHVQRPSDDIFVGNIAEHIDPNDENNQFESLYKTSSQSVNFLVKQIREDISVDINMYIYYRVYPTYDEQIKHYINRENSKRCKLVPIWKRKAINFFEIMNRDVKEVNLDFSKYLKEIRDDEDLLLKPTYIPKNCLDSKESYELQIAELKNESSKFDLDWEVKLDLSDRKFTQNNEKFSLVIISLINNTLEKNFLDRESRTKDIYFEPNLFDVHMDVNLNGNQIVPFKYEYTYDSYPKTSYSDVRSLNCNARYVEKENVIRTRGFSEYKQDKVSPKSSIPNIDISFGMMSRKEGLKELYALHGLMKEHLENCKSVGEKDKEYSDALHDFDLMQQRFKDGIDLLSSDSKVFKAFTLMNKAFLNNSKNKGYDSWRLFQIVFIVSLLRDIVDKDYKKDVCELLHVMTGGGKSESYFGLVIFSAFYDRIIGKEYGVTAITKFPLRMLSVQQLQRAASLLIWAEEIRVEERLGGDHFSMAYFVGTYEEFPRYDKKIISEIHDSKVKGEKIKGKIIEKCPICEHDVYLDIDIEHQLIIHKCEDCSRVFRLYYSDDEIYRTLPTFIIATVDKWAGIAQQRRVKNLIGGDIDICPNGHGFMPHNDFCETFLDEKEMCRKKGRLFDVSYDIGPSLIIQDEMHLINEGFGAIDSHFETLIETMHESFTGNKFKNIAMTATISGAKNQIKQLYNKNVCVFPPKLKNQSGEDFFFDEIEEDGERVVQRFLIGLKPNTTYVRLIFYILRYISEFIKYIEDDPKRFCSDNNMEIDKLNEILPYYKKLLTYHNKKDDVQAIPFNAYAYINSDEYEDSYNIDSFTLTGENTLDTIKETIHTIENYYDEEEFYEDRKDKILVVSATSIVSHGVDIDDWNVMVFDGMTRNTAEYIQALSRVGRKKCGIIFLAYKASRKRDLSFYQHFEEYHRIIDHKVEVVPLTRWPRLAFKQTITSIFTASVLNYMSNYKGMPLYTLKAFKDVFKHESNVVELKNFINKVYLCDQGFNEAENVKDMIDEEVDLRIDCLLNSYNVDSTFIVNELKNTNEKYFKTQFGMRGIQDMITLDAHSKNKAFLRKI